MGRPLDNHRHETFCQLYAGECFGFASKAYQGAGYKPKTEETARSEASRLLTNVNVWTRIQELREIRKKELAIDSTRILELRLQIAYDKLSKHPDRLSALKDVERSLGLEPSQKIELTGSVLVIEK